jgi:hypothetical protein
MHFRVLDLSAERCVWSIPPIGKVPMKLRLARLVVRCIDVAGNVLEVESVDGVKLEGLITRFFDNAGAARLNIHLAADESYAGHVRRLNRGEGSMAERINPALVSYGAV